MQAGITPDHISPEASYGDVETVVQILSERGWDASVGIELWHFESDAERERFMLDLDDACASVEADRSKQT